MPWNGAYIVELDMTSGVRSAPKTAGIDALRLNYPRFAQKLSETEIRFVSQHTSSADYQHQSYALDTKEVTAPVTMAATPTVYDWIIPMPNGFMAAGWDEGSLLKCEIFDKDGAAYSAPIVSDDPRSTDWAFADIKGRLHWIQRDTSQSGYYYDEYVHRLGGALAAPKRHCDEFDVKRPSIVGAAALYDGGHLLVWASSIGTPLDDDHSHGVFAMRFDEHGQPVAFDSRYTLQHSGSGTGSGGSGVGSGGACGCSGQNVSVCQDGGVTVTVHVNGHCC